MPQMSSSFASSSRSVSSPGGILWSDGISLIPRSLRVCLWSAITHTAVFHTLLPTELSSSMAMTSVHLPALSCKESPRAKSGYNPHDENSVNTQTLSADDIYFKSLSRCVVVNCSGTLTRVFSPAICVSFNVFLPVRPAPYTPRLMRLHLFQYLSHC